MRELVTGPVTLTDLRTATPGVSSPPPSARSAPRLVPAKMPAEERGPRTWTEERPGAAMVPPVTLAIWTVERKGAVSVPVRLVVLAWTDLRAPPPALMSLTVPMPRLVRASALLPALLM